MEAKVVTGERIEVIVDEIVPEVQENMKGILLSVWQQEDQKDLQWIEPQKVLEKVNMRLILIYQCLIIGKVNIILMFLLESIQMWNIL